MSKSGADMEISAQHVSWLFSCYVAAWRGFKPRANGRNIVGQQLPALLDVDMLRPFAHPVACCWMLLGVVAPSS